MLGEIISTPEDEKDFLTDQTLCAIEVDGECDHSESDARAKVVVTFDMLEINEFQFLLMWKHASPLSHVGLRRTYTFKV